MCAWAGALTSTKCCTQIWKHKHLPKSCNIALFLCNQLKTVGWTDWLPRGWLLRQQLKSRPAEWASPGGGAVSLGADWTELEHCLQHKSTSPLSFHWVISELILSVKCVEGRHSFRPFYSRYQRNQEKDGETKKCGLDPDFSGLCWILSKGHAGNYSGMTMSAWPLNEIYLWNLKWFYL